MKPALEVAKNKMAVVSEQDYAKTLADIINKIKEAQVKANISANKELVVCYWNVGKKITEKQKIDGWGAATVERLVADIQKTLQGVEGFSRANVFKIRAFYEAYEIVSQAVRQLEDLPIFHIPWGHNIMLVTKLKDTEERLWYARKSIEHGWSRSILDSWIRSNLYKREGKAITNFHKTLPEPQSDLAQQALKDPFLLDFLSLAGDFAEKDLEDGLILHMQKFLLELGQGFAFMGKQYPLTIEDSVYYIDLLFYHVKLRCYVVIELKATDFKPEHTGKLNFYLAVVDDLLKQPGDDPTIGILLCKSKNKVIADYALRGYNNPMGLAQYETVLTKALPQELKSKLPTITEIESELEKKSVIPARKAENTIE